MNEEIEIDWCIHHTTWESGCKYCGPRVLSDDELLLVEIFGHEPEYALQLNDYDEVACGNCNPQEIKDIEKFVELISKS